MGRIIVTIIVAVLVVIVCAIVLNGLNRFLDDWEHEHSSMTITGS